MKTINLQGKEYAQVKDRMLEFRTNNPSGLIETTPTITGNIIVFKARILKDKSDINSAEATGHAMGENKGAKAFEKIETIAVGRALALLGYGADGSIASSEEMEEFLQSKQSKKVEELMKQVDGITDVKVLREFYVANKGNGKELDNYILTKSNFLKNGNN